MGEFYCLVTLSLVLIVGLGLLWSLQAGQNQDLDAAAEVPSIMRTSRRADRASLLPSQAGGAAGT